MLSGVLAAVVAPILPSAAPAGAQQVIEEITVTARRIEERLSDVPLSITAFSADAIASARIASLEDVASLTPGLSFFNLAGQQLSTPTIRGIAQTDIFGTINVGIFVDGVYVAGRRGINFSQLDLQRIEVVKGPQSALYGRDAFSGAVNVVSARPTEELLTSFEGTLGNDGRLGGKAVVSGAILPGLLLGRAALLYDEFDGSYYDPVNDRGVGGYRYRTFQGSLQVLPLENLSITGTLYLSDDIVLSPAIIANGANCEPDTRPERNGRFLNYCGSFPKLDTTTLPRTPGATGEDRELIRSSLTANWDLDIGTFTSLSGYARERQQNVADGPRNLAGDQPFLYCGFFVCGEGVELRRFRSGLQIISPRSFTEEFSQELRFTSPQDEPLRYTAGAYYYTVEDRSRASGAIATSPLPADFGGFAAPIPWLPLPVPNLAIGPWFTPGGDVDPRPVSTTDTSSWALFSSVEIDFLERFTARADLRYTDESQRVTQFEYASDISETEPLASARTRDSWQYVSGGLTLRYRVSEDWMTYAYIAKAQKPGGFSEFSGTLLPLEPGGATEEVNLLVGYDTEENVTTEFGIKGSTADGRLRLDLAMYHTNWRSIVLPQVFDNDPVTGRPLSQPTAFSTNGGDARVWGWEMDVDAALTEELMLKFGVSYTDATFTNARLETLAYYPSFQVQTGVDSDDNPVFTGDVTGNQVQRQPKWQSNVSLLYRRPVTGDWEAFSRADYLYRGQWFADASNQAIIPSQSLVNLTLGLESPRYTVQLWARNLFNDRTPTGAYREIYFTNTADIGTLNTGTGEFDYALAPADAREFFPFQYPVSHPNLRTFGITAKVRFGGAMR